MDQIAEAKDTEYAERISAVETAAAETIALLDAQREEKLAALDAEYEKKAATLREKAEALAQDIEKMGDKPASKKLALPAAGPAGATEFVIAERYAPLPRNPAKRLQTELDKRLKVLERERGKKRHEMERALATELSKQREAATAEMETLRKAIIQEKEVAQAQCQEIIASLEELKDPVRDDQCTLLPEQKLRELTDRYPDLLTAGMGAEAIMNILTRLDLDTLAVKLRDEIQSFSGQRRKKATKRLRVVEAFRKSGSKPA